MHLNKTDGLTIGLITIAGIAILANGILRESPVELTDPFQYSDEVELTLDMPTDIMALEEEINSSEKPVDIKVKSPTLLSFSEAFAEARRMRGPGAIFEWNGKSYTTSLAEKLVNPNESLDSTQINLVMNQPPNK